MKKRSILIVVVTIFLIILFTYQPPVDGHARFSSVKRDTVLTEKPRLKLDTTLIDRLRSYKLLSDSLRVECKNQLNFIKQQQKILIEQMEQVEYLTTKN